MVFYFISKRQTAFYLTPGVYYMFYDFNYIVSLIFKEVVMFALQNGHRYSGAPIFEATVDSDGVDAHGLLCHFWKTDGVLSNAGYVL